MTDVLYLSERNLRTLLSKLERKAKGDSTMCTLIKYKQNTPEYKQSMDEVIVVAVADDIYYAAQNRIAGDVHPLDSPNTK